MAMKVTSYYHRTNPDEAELPVHDVDAGMHHDRVPDRDLSGEDRQPVSDPRQHRDPRPLQPRFEPIEDLGEERVGDPAQPQHLDQRREP